VETPPRQPRLRVRLGRSLAPPDVSGQEEEWFAIDEGVCRILNRILPWNWILKPWVRATCMSG